MIATSVSATAVSWASAGGADLHEVTSVQAAKVAEYDRIAFGCPSMGDEVLEEGDMEPFFTEAEGLLSGKKVALFGSYDRGDGQWMRDWAERAKAAGASVCGGEGLAVNLTPDGEGLAQCKKLGADLAAM